MEIGKKKKEKKADLIPRTQISTNEAFATPNTVSSPASAVPATPLSVSAAVVNPLNGSPRSIRAANAHRRIPSGHYFPSHSHSATSSPKSAGSATVGGYPDGGDSPASASVVYSRQQQHSSPRSTAAAGGHRPRLSQSHTAPTLPSVAEGTATSPERERGPPPRPRLRNVSSSSTLLGVSLSASSSSSSTATTSGNATTSQLGGPFVPSDPQQTPLAAPPAPPPGVYEAAAAGAAAAAGIVAGPGLRASAIGYPFPPVGDLAVPGGGGGATPTPSLTSSGIPPPANSISTPTAAASFTTTTPLAPRSSDGGSSGLSSKPLDYSLLSSRELVQDELESTLLEMGKWLDLVSEGLGRVVNGQVDVGVGLVNEGGARDESRSAPEQVRTVIPLQVSA